MKLLASLCVLFAVVLVAPDAASATASGVGIGVVRPNADERGSFAVPVWTDEPGANVTTVTATIRDGGTTVATVPLAPQLTAGFWAPASPLRLTEDGGTIAALGRYAIDVSATDSDAGTTTRVDAGTLDFTLRPEFEAVNPPDTLAFTQSMSRGNEHTAVTGRLLGVQPGSGDRVPLAARDVSITRAYVTGMPDPVPDSTVPATTDSEGRFTTADAPQTWWATYRSSFTADDAEVHGTASGRGEPFINPEFVDVSAQSARAIVEPGQQININGRVTSGTTPVAGVQVRISTGWSPNFDQTPVFVTTDGNGRFSGAITAVSGSFDGRAHWTAETNDPFVTGTRSGTVEVPDEASYSGVSVVLDASGRVTARGTLSATYDPAYAIYAAQLTYLQYSRNGKTGWINLAHVRPSELYAPVRLSASGYVDGYYRLYHPTSAEFAHTYSAVVHRSRILTRIAGNNAGPEPVRTGHAVTVTGTLQEYRSGAWRILGRRPVDLFFRANGARKWTYLGSGRTDSRGRAKLRGKATKDGWWVIQYWGDSGHFNSGATSDYVDAR